MLPNNNVSMSVGHLDHVLLTVHSLMEHVTWSHLVPCVAEFVGPCIPIHAYRCLPDPKCLFYPSGLLLCLSVDHFVLSQSMTWFSSVMADLWVTLLSLAWRLGSVYQLWKSPLLSVFLDPGPELPACLSNVWAGAVLARHTIDQFSLLFILDLVIWMNHKVP